MPLCRHACPLLAGLSIVAAAAPAQTLSPSQRDAIQAWYQTTAHKAPGEWGIAIGTLDGQVLWSSGADQALIPASTAKVFTTGYARDRVGGSARKTTRVVGSGTLDPRNGEWLGEWAIHVTGDPTFERPDRSGPTLADLAAGLRARGIRQLDGPLILTSRLGPPAASYPAVWSSRYAGKLYAPPIGPVTLHENTVSFTIRPGAVGTPPQFAAVIPAGAEALVQNRARTVPGRERRLKLLRNDSDGWILTGTIGRDARTVGFSDVAQNPTAVLATAWAAALRRAGIRWNQTRRPAAAEPRPVVLAEVQSAPLDSVATEVNRRSLNIGAELLLQWGAGNQTDGPAEVTQFVRNVVGPFARIEMVDGSGLSDFDRVSPLTQMLYLARITQRPGAQNFPLLLPANGTGTLKHLRHGLAPGVVHAKTGTLDEVAAVTGYLGRPDGVLVLSLMYNGRRTVAARQAQWKLFRLLGADGVSVPTALETQMGGPVVK